MKRYLEKLAKNLKSIDSKMIYENKIDNAYVDISLRKIEKSPDRIRDNELFDIFGEEILNINILKFARIFKMDSKPKRERIKNERDELINLYLNSFYKKEIVLTDFLKSRNVSYVSYKAFLIEISNMKLEIKDSLVKIIENTNVKGCKKIVEDMFKFQDMHNLRENTRELEESFEGEELVQFFKKLNSRKTDYLLDRLAFLVKELESDESKEKEMFLLKNLFKFFRSVGLSPIKKYGDNFEVTLKEIEDGEYIGEPFKDLESKEVNLERLGWRYGKVQISPIVYKEIKKEEF